LRADSDPRDGFCPPRMSGATTIEVASDHVAMGSHPGEVLGLIQAAARAVPVAG